MAIVVYITNSLKNSIKEKYSVNIWLSFFILLFKIELGIWKIHQKDSWEGNLSYTELAFGHHQDHQLQLMEQQQQSVQSHECLPRVGLYFPTITEVVSQKILLNKLVSELIAPKRYQLLPDPQHHHGEAISCAELVLEACQMINAKCQMPKDTT